MTGSWGRIRAMMLRHYYMIRGSWARIFDFLYWPSLMMIMWGFVGRHYAQAGVTDGYYVLGSLLGAVLMWDMLFRTQLGMSFAYLEEIWSRNLGHLFVSPLRPYEWWLSMMLFSVCRMLVGALPAVLLAIPFYGFSLFSVGPVLALFLFNLVMMGWTLGFFASALLLRAGPGAESMVWAITWFLAPFSAVYYPVASLPEWLQPLARAIPASHVFEGLRDLLLHGSFASKELWTAFGLNCLYMALAACALNAAMNNARREGTLLQTGE